MKALHGAAVLCAACLIAAGAAALPEPAAVRAAEEEQPVYEGLKYEKTEDAVTITGFTEDLPEKVTVPAEIGGLPVTKIGADAFRFCMTVTEIEVPESVTELGAGAFKGCYQLRRAVLPDHIRVFPDNLFADCRKLETVRVPAELEHIGEAAFSKCYVLAELDIPDGVKTVGDSAFFSTVWLENKRAENPFVIVNHVLIDGKACTGDITVPAEVNVIGESAFAYNHNLTNVVIPAHVTEIRRYGLYDCDGIETVTVLNPDCEICDMKATISNHYARHEAFMLGTIRGLADSTAQAYAEKYGYSFEVIVPSEIRGDFNGDCMVGIEDAQQILSAYAKKLAGSDAGLTEEQVQKCDINGDGAVDAADAQLVLNYYVKNTIANTPTAWEQILSQG